MVKAGEQLDVVHEGHVIYRCKLLCTGEYNQKWNFYFYKRLYYLYEVRHVSNVFTPPRVLSLTL